jgi:predicted metal-dependent hydrolase
MSRDRYGRPLREPFDPALVVAEVPERSFIEGLDAWQEAMDYLTRDLPFHAHEVFEQRWRCAPADERLLWRGLAQWGAACTHAARGNVVGAKRLAERALQSVDQSMVVPEYVDLAFMRQHCSELADLT